MNINCHNNLNLINSSNNNNNKLPVLLEGLTELLRDMTGASPPGRLSIPHSMTKPD
jgi:hypothetical protein